jgi:hypothetical protein
MALQLLAPNNFPPRKKIIAWTDSIKDILSRGTSTTKELETTIGKLGHFGTIVPLCLPFSKQATRPTMASHKVQNDEDFPTLCGCLTQDAFLSRKSLQGHQHEYHFLQMPSTHIYRSDLCPFGLGGYSHKGFAWRFKIPEDLQFRAATNLLEFMASIIMPWVDIIAQHHKKGDCILSMTNSTTSTGWIMKAKFREIGEDPLEARVQIEVARHHASLILDAEAKEYSQWFPGSKKNVAGALSWDFNCNDKELT